MKTSRRSQLFLAGLAAVLAAAAMTGCAAAEPPASTATHSKPAGAQPMPQRAITMPVTQRGEVARLTIGLGETLTGTTIAVPPSKHGYTVRFSCLASNPQQRAGYEIDEAGGSSSTMSASTAKCDGTPNANQDASMSGGYKLVDFHLIGNLAGVQMYAVLTPGD